MSTPVTVVNETPLPGAGVATHRSADATRSASLSSSRLLVLVLTGGLLLRVILLLSMAHAGVKADDEHEYRDLAQNVAEGRGLASTAFGTTSIRPPLYPAFVAALWRLSGTESLQAVRGAQIVLSLGTVILVFGIARKLYDERVAVIAASLWCFYPSFLYGGVLLLTEVLFTLLLLVTCYLALETIERRSAWTALAAGASLGLAALTRSVLWPLPILLAPLAVIALGARSRSAYAIALSLFAGFVIVVAPWAIRNTRLQKTFTVVDTMGGLNLRMGNYEHTLEDRMWDGVSITGEKAWYHQLFIEHPDAKSWTEGQREKWAQRKALAYVFQHPVVTAKRAALKFADFWGLEREYVAALSKGEYDPPRWFAIASSAAVLLAYPALMLLVVRGLSAGLPGDHLQHGFILFLVAFVCGIHTVVFGHSRYHLPLMPLLVIYAAAAIAAREWRGLRTDWRPWLMAGLLIAIWTREVLFRDAEHIARLMGAL